VFLEYVLVGVDSHTAMASSQMILKCTRPRPSLSEVLLLPLETKASCGYATLLALLRDEVTFALSQTIVTCERSLPRIVEPMNWDMKESSGQLFMMMSLMLCVSTMFSVLIPDVWMEDRIYEKVA
jgi:hypothetical protein